MQNLSEELLKLLKDYISNSDGAVKNLHKELAAMKDRLENAIEKKVAMLNDRITAGYTDTHSLSKEITAISADIKSMEADMDRLSILIREHLKDASCFQNSITALKTTDVWQTDRLNMHNKILLWAGSTIVTMLVAIIIYIVTRGGVLWTG